MSMSQVPLFSLLTSRMSWLSARQSVFAENISNADTPHYVARDIKQPDFANLLAGEERGLAATNARHFTLGGSGGSSNIMDAGDEGGSPTGNAVSLEQEMIKLSDTQIQYQTAANLYQKAVGMFRTALSGHS